MLVFGLSLVSFSHVFAYDAGAILLEGANITVSSTGGVPISRSEVQDIAGTLVGNALTLVGALFFVLMIYGGITWMLARGNEEYTKRALNTIVAAIVGLIVVAASYAITQFVINSVKTQSAIPANAPGCCVLVDGSTGDTVADVGTAFSCQGTNNIIANFYPVPNLLSAAATSPSLLTSLYCENNCSSRGCDYANLNNAINSIPNNTEVQI